MSGRAVAVLLLVSWGAAAFGAVYPWASVPLYGGCGLFGAVTLLRRPDGRRRVDRRLAFALLVVLAAIGAQLLPLPPAALQQVSPATDAFLRDYELAYSASPTAHPLSIDPRATATALAHAISLAIFLLGLSTTLDRAVTRHIVRGIVAAGVMLAIAGMAQAALWNGKIYGFWTPYEEGSPFGPFVNRNHFAGWMLQAIPLGIGYLCARVSTAMTGVSDRLRDRVIWFSSPEASETILVGFGVLVMTVALVLTLSRSGILGLFSALVLTGWFAVRRQRNVRRRLVVAAYLVLVLAFSVAWTGVGRLAARFDRGDAVTVGSRIGAWKDTWRMTATYPLTGTGVNTYGTAMLLYQTEQGRHYMQAHNDYLQLLSEGGLLLLIPVSTLVLVTVVIVRERFGETRRTRTDWTRIGAVTGILAIALQELGDFSLQIPGNAVMFCVLLGIAVAPVEDGDGRIGRRSV